MLYETQSEQDFAEMCLRQGWSPQKLETAPDEGLRTPDFMVTTQTGYEFVAEVTEFQPERPREPGEVRVRETTVGNPIRAKLAEKKSQVRRFASDYPTVIVLSGRFEHFAYLEEHSFDSALYGELAVGVAVAKDPRIEPRFDHHMHNAGRRFFGPKHNTSISAVAALDRRPQKLRFFHNRHAKIPLEPARLLIGTRNVEHFVKPDDGKTGWHRLTENVT